jgi:hypothetical protein
MGHNKRTCFFNNKADDFDRLIELECETQLANCMLSSSLPVTPTFRNFANESEVSLCSMSEGSHMVLPLPSAPEMPIPVLAASEEPQPAYAFAPMALLEEALAHAQTRAREAEERVDVLTAERDDALALVALLQVELADIKKSTSDNTEALQSKVLLLQTSVDRLIVRNERFKATIELKNKELEQLRSVKLQHDALYDMYVRNPQHEPLKQEVTKLKKELANALSSNTEALHTISNLLDENKKLSKNKLSDAEEFALLLDQYDVHRTYIACKDRVASGQGNDEDTFTREVLRCWLELFENLKSGKSIWLDKHGNILPILVKKLITGWKEPGWLPAFTVPLHGTVPHINYNLAKWLKQKGYLPCDFKCKCCCDESCEFHNML